MASVIRNRLAIVYVLYACTGMYMNNAQASEQVSEVSKCNFIAMSHAGLCKTGIRSGSLVTVMDLQPDGMYIIFYTMCAHK